MSMVTSQPFLQGKCQCNTCAGTQALAMAESILTGSTAHAAKQHWHAVRFQPVMYDVDMVKLKFGVSVLVCFQLKVRQNLLQNR